MLTIPPSANSPTTLSLLPSVLAVATPDIVSTRATPVALPAPLSDQPAADNASANVTVFVPPPTENTAPVPANTNNTPGTLANNLSASGPSSSFLAQLLGQSDTNNNSVALAATYARFAPAPEYNTFVGYSFIKYKPSDAGLPPQRSPLPSPVTTYTDTASSVLPAESAPPAPEVEPAITFAPPANDFQAYAQTQSRNQSNLTFTQPLLIVAG